MSRWIPFSEQLPPEETFVWVCVAGEAMAIDRPTRHPCRNSFTHWQIAVCPADPVPPREAMTLRGLLELMLEGLNDAETARGLEFGTPLNWRVKTVPVFSEIRAALAASDKLDLTPEPASV